MVFRPSRPDKDVSADPVVLGQLDTMTIQRSGQGKEQCPLTLQPSQSLLCSRGEGGVVNSCSVRSWGTAGVCTRSLMLTVKPSVCCMLFFGRELEETPDKRFLPAKCLCSLYRVSEVHLV